MIVHGVVVQQNRLMNLLKSLRRYTHMRSNDMKQETMEVILILLVLTVFVIGIVLIFQYPVLFMLSPFILAVALIPALALLGMSLQ
jgi:hypothetical protein